MPRQDRPPKGPLGSGGAAGLPGFAGLWLRPHAMGTLTPKRSNTNKSHRFGHLTPQRRTHSPLTQRRSQIRGRTLTGLSAHTPRDPCSSGAQVRPAAHRRAHRSAHSAGPAPSPHPSRPASDPSRRPAAHLGGTLFRRGCPGRRCRVPAPASRRRRHRRDPRAWEPRPPRLAPHPAGRLAGGGVADSGQTLAPPRSRPAGRGPPAADAARDTRCGRCAGRARHRLSHRPGGPGPRACFAQDEERFQRRSVCGLPGGCVAPFCPTARPFREPVPPPPRILLSATR